MKTKHIIIGLIILVIVLFLMQKKEHAGGTPIPLSNDALVNIGLVYGNTGPGKTASFNNIRATGNANVKNLIADGSGNFKGNVLFNGNTTFKRAGTGTGTTNFPASDNKNYIRGLTEIDDIATFNTSVNLKGGSGSTAYTQFPFEGNSENYIRGNTQIDGDVKINNGILYKGDSLLKCNWDGDKQVTGVKGCRDDMTITCKNDKIHKFALPNNDC